jgi:hypothetical protein
MLIFSANQDQLFRKSTAAQGVIRRIFENLSKNLGKFAALEITTF